jgi:threonine/homoserine/homoserine lactone efflux protein
LWFKEDESKVITFLSAGVALGLYAGFSPGPLITLVISQSVKHGPKEGVKVAFAPLLTDFPILLISTFLLNRLSNYTMILGVVSVLGALFLVYLAYTSMKTRGVEVNTDEEVPYSFLKGAMVNALSPNPYVFWITIGAPMIIRGFAESYIASLLFVGSFLGCLVGSKCFVAIIAGKSRHFLTGRAYLYIMRTLGVVLLVFAFILFRDGLCLLR